MSLEQGLFSAILDAIFGSDEDIAGKPVTRLVAPLLDTETTTMVVESTLSIGENTDGSGDARLLVGGEIIETTGRTDGPGTFTFDTLSRGLDNTKAITHPPGSLVFDLSDNASALDLLRRGLLVDYAVGEDLDIIGRNLGLTRCPGITEDQWRAVIKAVAYLPKSTIHAFDEALEALLGASQYAIRENITADPWKVFVDVIVLLATSLRGRFMLNGGEPALTTGLTTVDVDYDVIEPALALYLGEASQTYGLRTIDYPAGSTGTATVGVYLDTPESRRGLREGLTNYFLPGGSVAGATITLGTSPGAAGTAVIVDYTALSAHYLALNETVSEDADYYAYLSDPLLAVRCLLDQIRAAGIHAEVAVQV